LGPGLAGSSGKTSPPSSCPRAPWNHSKASLKLARKTPSKGFALATASDREISGALGEKGAGALGGALVCGASGYGRGAGGVVAGAGIAVLASGSEGAVTGAGAGPLAGGVAAGAGVAVLAAGSEGAATGAGARPLAGGVAAGVGVAMLAAGPQGAAAGAGIGASAEGNPKCNAHHAAPPTIAAIATAAAARIAGLRAR
jgi:hypothetical protein